MDDLKPLYTLENCSVAYQLNWSLTVFWRQRPVDSNWLPPLTEATEKDGVRVLRHRFLKSDTSQFFLSTKLEVTSVNLLRSVKGRLQYAVREENPKALRRNYDLHSIGSANRSVVQGYLDSQLNHHPSADSRVERRLARFQIHDPTADLSRPRSSAHGRFLFNLHLVLVNDGRWREIREDILGRLRSSILKIADRRGHILSRAAIVPDHVHLILGCPLDVSPANVALCYMNNLAYALGMKPLFKAGFYVGTFGEYDRGAIGR
jgi:putative transposase